MQNGSGKKIRRFAAAEGEAATERAFHAYGKRIQSVTEFRYLGRILTSTDNEWPAVARNLQKARVTRGRLARILGRVGADPNVSRQYKNCVTPSGPLPPVPVSSPASPM